METDRLRYFCAIAETGSLTAAAEILNVSHSGLSKAMSVLQNELKQQLFRPLGRGLELTDAGRDTYEKSKVLLAQIENLKKLKPLSEGSLARVGMAEIFALKIAGPLALAMNQIGMAVDYYELDSGEAENMVRDGRLDFALTFVPFPQSDMEYLKIKTVSMGVYCTNRNFLNMQLSEVPFVVPNHSIGQNPLSLKSRDGWPTETQRTVKYGAASLSLALQIVEQGLAAVFMPRFLSSPGYIEIPTGKMKRAYLTRDLFLLKRKNAEESKIMKTAAKIIRNQC
jgi:DNA-binding transcriptional LysR family regulator